MLPAILPPQGDAVKSHVRLNPFLERGLSYSPDAILKSNRSKLEKKT